MGELYYLKGNFNYRELIYNDIKLEYPGGFNLKNIPVAGGISLNKGYCNIGIRKVAKSTFESIEGLESKNFYAAGAGKFIHKSQTITYISCYSNDSSHEYIITSICSQFLMQDPDYGPIFYLLFYKKIDDNISSMEKHVINSVKCNQ